MVLPICVTRVIMAARDHVSPTMPLPGVWLVCLGAALLLAACAAVTAAPTPSADTVADQLARGGPLYAQNCATSKCHGTQGEGLRSGGGFQVWPSVGPNFEARNPNAQVVFDVVRSGGEQNLRGMTDQQIYDAIAYELSQNSVHLAAPLTTQNAAATLSGSSASTEGRLYPPPGNVVLLPGPAVASALPALAGNDYLGLRVDQAALASTIGDATPPAGGAFLVLVLAVQNQTGAPLDLDPKFLQLQASSGATLAPQPVDLAYPIERFHHQTIAPDHGTAAVVIFALPVGAAPAQLTYDDQTGHALSVILAP